MTTTKEYLFKLERKIQTATNRLEAAQYLLRNVETLKFDWLFKHVSVKDGAPVVHTYPATVEIERCVFAEVQLHLFETKTQYRVLQAYDIPPAQWNILADMADAFGRNRLERFELFLKQDEKWKEMFKGIVCSEYYCVDFTGTALYEHFRKWEEMLEFIEELEYEIPKTISNSKPTMKI